MIAQVYEVEAVIREQSLSGERKRLHRLEHAKPLVEQFFAWVDEQLAPGVLRTRGSGGGSAVRYSSLVVLAVAACIFISSPAGLG